MAYSKNTCLTGLPLIMFFVLSSCSAPASQPRIDFQAVGQNTLWLAPARNSTGASLRIPGSNPLRSLAEMAGKVSSDYRPTVMDLLRESLKQEFTQRTTTVRFPEETDARLSALPLGPDGSARIAREAKLTGLLLLSEIRRWDAEAPGLIRLWVEFKLVRIADGGLLWERRVQKAFPAARSGNVGEVYNDAVKTIIHEIF
jgi:hypothetical protein